MRKLGNDELNRIDVDTYRQSDKTPFVLVLDNVRSALNVGSVFRTADAFLLQAVYLCGITAQPPNRDIRKTALGATQSVDWLHFGTIGQAVEELQGKGYTICAVEQADQSTQLASFQPEKGKKYALVFGHEVNGVNGQIVAQADHCIEIPQFGTKHSLNIAVSVGIVVWDLTVKWQQLTDNN